MFCSARSDTRNKTVHTLEARRSSWSFMQRLRIIAMIGLIGFSLFVAINNGMAARSRPQQNPASDDAVSKWEKRVKPMLKRVPDNIEVFGYVADWDLPNAQYNLVDQET